MPTTNTAWEVFLATEYAIDENLMLGVDGAYVRLNLDSDTWHGAEDAVFKDNYRVSVLFTYRFCLPARQGEHMGGECFT